ncbi:AAA family ATPase [Holdemanella porci]|uniref:AAA family ATPase n=1 Tax=Holdemanella porci TaxID=2652276 RepID=UPI003FD7ADE1
MFINGFDILWDEIDDYVADIQSIRSIDQFTFTKPVTFFCGENGSGKSTLLEALAIKNGLNPEGGTRNYDFSTYDSYSSLHKHMRLCVLKNRIGCISCVQKAFIMLRQKKWNIVVFFLKDIMINHMVKVSFLY